MSRDDVQLVTDAPRVVLNIPQGDFLRLPHKYRLYVAGFGSGKTFAGALATCAHFIQHPRIDQGYFAPTYPHIRDIYYPTIEEAAHYFGMRVRVVESNKEVHFYRGNWYYGVVKCRSMDRPSSIVGFKIGRAHVDEIDTLPIDKAREAWRKIIARMRYKIDGLANGVDATTTPEGFRFAYEQWVEKVRQDPKALRALYGMVQAATRQNRINLPADYIPSLLASYPEALIAAYLEGEFINLTQGSVYPAFNRILNFTSQRLQQGEPLHIGMDFNVGRMAAIVHAIRKGRPYALDEIHDVLDTPAMIGALQLKFPGRSILVYPDASGGNRKTQNASSTDLALLRQAGYQTLNNPANPLVRDRVLCMNKAFEQGYWVNPDTCPRYTESLEKQAYDKNGEPDKSSGFDHGNDAGGYFIAYRFPQVHNRIQRVKLAGT